MPYKNIEDRKKQSKRWYEKARKNPEYMKQRNTRANERLRERRATDPEFRKKEIEKVTRNRIQRRAKTPWLLHWNSANTRCLDTAQCYKYYGGKGIRMLLTKEEIEILYKRDNAGQMKRPSIDRINSNGNYSFENCRFIELFENNSRAHRGR